MSTRVVGCVMKFPSKEKTEKSVKRKKGKTDASNNFPNVLLLGTNKCQCKYPSKNKQNLQRRDEGKTKS